MRPKNYPKKTGRKNFKDKVSWLDDADREDYFRNSEDEEDLEDYKEDTEDLDAGAGAGTCAEYPRV